MTGLPLLALILVPLQPAASAHTPADSPTHARAPALFLKPEQMFALAERAEARSDQPTATSIYQALARDPDRAVRTEARFRLAMRLAAADRTRDAAVLFRRVLDEVPSASAARLQLALALHKLGDHESALRELRLLRSSELPLAATHVVDRLTALLQANRPFGMQLEIALAPDSNINAATRSDRLGTIFGDFKLDDESKARSGIGLALRGAATARILASDRLALVGRAGADASLNLDKDFNSIGLDLSLGPEFRLADVRFNAEAAATQHWYGLQPYQRGLRIGGGAAALLSPTTQLRIDGAVRLTDNRINDLQDGRGMLGRLRLERALSPQLLVSASLSGDRFKAADAAYSTRSWQGGLAAYRSIGRVTLSTSIDVGRLHADDRLLLLPSARSDRLVRLTFGSVFRNLEVAGFAPMSRAIIERNRSNIAYYDYQRMRTELGITRAF